MPPLPAPQPSPPWLRAVADGRTPTPEGHEGSTDDEEAGEEEEKVEVACCRTELLGGGGCQSMSAPALRSTRMQGMRPLAAARRRGVWPVKGSAASTLAPAANATRTRSTSPNLVGDLVILVVVDVYI